MARIRTIKPELHGSPSLAKCSVPARYVFTGLLPLADDEGRLRDAPKTIVGALFPYDEDVIEKDLIGNLDELEAVDCIRRYSVDGVNYIYLPGWHDHQHIGKPTPSKLPVPPEASQGIPGEPEDSHLGKEQGTGNREQGRGVEPVASDDPEILRLCTLLADLMVENGCKRPTISEAWTTDMDRLVRLDDRSPAEVDRVIRWSQASDFWASNIMSPKKLREKFDTLGIQSKQRSVSTDNRSKSMKTVDDVLATITGQRQEALA